MPWSVALCSCNDTLGWDPRAIQRALDLAAPPALYRRLPRDEIHRFLEALSASGADRVAVGCCAGPELFREVAGAAGLGPERVAVVNPREDCFWVHPDRAAANAKAARLLRAAMQAGEAGRPVPELAMRVGAGVLIATDSEAGLDLARRLAEVARPVVVLDDRSAAFDDRVHHPLPWPTSWGVVAGVEGHLGAFRVTVERAQPIDLRACITCRRCIPVCHTAAISEALRLRLDRCDRCGDCLQACAEVGAIRIPRAEQEVVGADQVVVVTSGAAPEGPRRTGHHVLGRPTAAEVEALAWKVFGLIGDFKKPLAVRYDPDTCAGGAASHQACGRCVTACPYQAISRDPRNPLRVAVDQAACEACGACVAACPTSSLAWTDPPAEALHGRLQALLAPLAGAGDGAAQPLVVAFHCPERGAAALAEAGRRRRDYPAGVLPVPVACLRQVSEDAVLAAFGHGAAGVALVGCEACPHGERQGLLDRLEVVSAFLDAFGLGRERVHLLSGEGLPLVEALDRFAAGLAPSPVRWDGSAGRPAAAGREATAGAIAALIAATGRTPGRTRVPAAAPFAFPDVQVRGCTLCRTCVNVCPTHAFRYDEPRQALELRQVACVNCDLCARACPEAVITLRNETFLDRGALDWQVVVQDEPLRCLKCNTPFGNRRAVEVIEAKVLGMTGLLDTFAGARRNLLRMCPTCRAAAAVLAMQEGWEP